MSDCGAVQLCCVVWCGVVWCGRTLLYSLFTHDCMAMYDSKPIIKISDDTTVVGLITANDEMERR